MKHFRGSCREAGLLTAVSSNAVECLALQFFCSLPSDCVFSFFLSFGHLFRTELRTSPSLWWNFSSEENRNGECEGGWTVASPARQHEQGIAYTYILLHIYAREPLCHFIFKSSCFFTSNSNQHSSATGLLFNHLSPSPYGTSIWVLDLAFPSTLPFKISEAAATMLWCSFSLVVKS